MPEPEEASIDLEVGETQEAKGSSAAEGKGADLTSKLMEEEDGSDPHDPSSSSSSSNSSPVSNENNQDQATQEEPADAEPKKKERDITGPRYIAEK